MDFFSKKARGITPYTAGEQLRGKTYVKLNTNENPYPPSPRVMETLARMNPDDLRRYPRPDAGRLREALAAREGDHARQHARREFLLGDAGAFVRKAVLALRQLADEGVLLRRVLHVGLFQIKHRTAPRVLESVRSLAPGRRAHKPRAPRRYFKSM